MEEIMNVENTALANPFNNESNFKMLMKMAEAFASRLPLGRWGLKLL